VDFQIYSGLYVPSLKDHAEFERAILLVNEKGAGGVSLFTAESLNDDQKQVLIKLKIRDK
jgi:hypothetical protein